MATNATTKPDTTTAGKTAGKAATKPAAKSASKVAAKPSGFTSVDVRKTLTDAGYIAVGIGVLGVQQAQARRQKLIEQVTAATDEITARARKGGERLQALPSKLSERLGGIDPTNVDFGARLDEVKARVETARERANEIGEQTRVRISPALERFETRVNDLPRPLPQAAAPAVKAAKQLLSA